MPEERRSAVATGVRHFKASGHELSAIRRLNRNWRTIDNGVPADYNTACSGEPGEKQIVRFDVRGILSTERNPDGHESIFSRSRKQEGIAKPRSWMLNLPKLREQCLFLFPPFLLSICVYVARMLNSYSTNVGLEPRGFWSILKYRLHLFLRGTVSSKNVPLFTLWLVDTIDIFF